MFTTDKKSEHHPSLFSAFPAKILLGIAVIVLVITSVLMTLPATEDNFTPDELKKLGDAHYFGTGVTQNLATALMYYQQAAEKGNADALAMIGNMYYVGHGVKQDKLSAQMYYDKAAEAGSIIGMLNAGNMYYAGPDENGQGSPQDYQLAMYYYQNAANLGNADAMRLIGILYYNGDGVLQNTATAKAWFEMAAEFGDQEAKEILSRSRV